MTRLPACWSAGVHPRRVIPAVGGAGDDSGVRAVAVFPGSQQVKIIEQDVPRLTQPDQVALRLLDAIDQFALDDGVPIVAIDLTRAGTRD